MEIIQRDTKIREIDYLPNQFDLMSNGTMT